jgi:hypothetical protein
MSPKELTDELASLRTRAEPVTQVFVLFSPSLIPGVVSRYAWLERRDAERQRDIMLSDLGLSGASEHVHIQILELTIYKRVSDAPAKATWPDTAAIPVHEEVLPGDGQADGGQDPGRPGA